MKDKRTQIIDGIIDEITNKYEEKYDESIPSDIKIDIDKIIKTTLKFENSIYNIQEVKIKIDEYLLSFKKKKYKR